MRYPPQDQIIPEQERASTGIPGLDHILGGGLPAAHLYLIEGTPGAAAERVKPRRVVFDRVRLGSKGIQLDPAPTDFEGVLSGVALCRGALPLLSDTDRASAS